MNDTYWNQEEEEEESQGLSIYFGIPGINDHTEGIEYKPSSSLEDFLQNRNSTPREVVDLRSQFFKEGGRTRVEIPFEKGKFIARPNPSLINPSSEPIIRYYPDNSEYNAANMQNLNDLAVLQQIYSTVGGTAASLAGARPQPQHIVFKKPGHEIKIPLTKSGMLDAKAQAWLMRQKTTVDNESIIAEAFRPIPAETYGSIVRKGGLFDPHRNNPNYLFKTPDHPTDGSINIGSSGRPLQGAGQNIFLTYSERKGISPLPSKKEVMRRQELGRNWQNLQDTKPQRKRAPKIRQRKGESDRDYAVRIFEARFSKINLTDDVKFNLKRMLDSNLVSKEVRREIKMGISNPYFAPKDYLKTREILVEEFLDGLEFLAIDPKTIEVHHVAGLRQTAQLFEGLDRSEFQEMLKLIWAEGIFTGNDPLNLIPIQKKAHYPDKKHPKINAVHKYLTEKLGLYGQKITGDWGVDIREMSPKERIPIIKEFARIVKSSYPIARQAIRDALDIDVSEQSPEAAAIAALDISEEVGWDKVDVDYVKSQIDNYIKLQTTKPSVEAILDSIFGKDSPGEARRRRGIKPGQPVQNQLFDLGKTKPPRKKPKITKKDNEYPSGPGAYWDIDSE